MHIRDLVGEVKYEINPMSNKQESLYDPDTNDIFEVIAKIGSDKQIGLYSMV